MLEVDVAELTVLSHLHACGLRLCQVNLRGLIVGVLESRWLDDVPLLGFLSLNLTGNLSLVRVGIAHRQPNM